MSNKIFRQLTDWLGVGDASNDWQEIAERPLLILVGVTGVGKTTTVKALKAAGVPFTLLPNRRDLTDELIIGQMQAAAGEPIQPVRDRIRRFAYTARYRDQYPGGMAHALSQLLVHPERTPTERLVFDGLRGTNEVRHAAELLPRAYFLVLEAPLIVRVKRLLGRGDAFDHVGQSTQQASGHETSWVVPSGADILTEEEGQALAQMVNSGLVTAAALQAKLKIVLTERQNYNPDRARETLLRMVPERTIVADTVTLSPADIAIRTSQKWR